MADDSDVSAWMRRSTTGKLKLRIATTILLVSTIHLLHLYLDPAQAGEEARFMLIAQVVFIATAAAFVIFNWLEHRPQKRGGS